jgi:hypothetical protein
MLMLGGLVGWLVLGLVERLLALGEVLASAGWVGRRATFRCCFFLHNKNSVSEERGWLGIAGLDLAET